MFDSGGDRPEGLGSRQAVQQEINADLKKQRGNPPPDYSPSQSDYGESEGGTGEGAIFSLLAIVGVIALICYFLKH